MVEEKELEILHEIGKITVEALLKTKEQIKPGAKLLDVANTAENFLRENGYGLSFPINLSINEQAAHYTPSLNDEKVFSENDLVKVDFGAEKNGLLGDGAITIDLSSNNQKLVDAAGKALENAISSVRTGVSVSTIGKVIGNTIEEAGFKPVRNLGGHELHTHDLHAGLFIPNYDNLDQTKLEEGMVIAIEPFVTNGKGLVVNSDIFEIYGYVTTTNIRSNDARMLLQEIESKYNSEPFAVRWLSNIIDSKFRLYAAIGELMRAGSIEPYPTLVEANKGLISQAEAQLVVEKDSCRVLTKVEYG